jgi:hypothetical protein
MKSSQPKGLAARAGHASLAALPEQHGRPSYHSTLRLVLWYRSIRIRA